LAVLIWDSYFCSYLFYPGEDTTLKPSGIIFTLFF
jgi:hypothetical protein